MVRIFINSGVKQGGSRQHAGDHCEFCRRGSSGVLPGPERHIGARWGLIAGSNTVSNMMFSQFQFEVAQTLGSPPPPCWRCEVVGAMPAT